ncbi:MAG: cytochrome c-type biogenesis protein CcmH [candidate division NC10 bacterium]|nr:cytochrome c-type biogenesis protein CcmH [candidate division NC10 bacterium]
MNVRRRRGGVVRPGATGVCRGGGIYLAFLVLSIMVVVLPLGASSLEEQVRQITAELRCPVCQGLSVADSPSRMANQMRDLIRERLQAGESPEAVKAYFVERYGEWILLAPKREGFNLLVWVLPFLGLGGGAVVLVVVLRRWRKRAEAVRASVDVDPAYLDRVRREMAQDQS